MLIRFCLTALSVAILSFPASAEVGLVVSGKWTLDAKLTAGAYMLASGGAQGSYLICFDAGNVPQVQVAVGDERSVLARGSCTVFSPRQDNGIILDLTGDAALPVDDRVALGTFRLILEDRNGLN